MPPQKHREEEEEDSESESLSDTEPAEECEDDRCRGPQPPIWHCVDCDSSYCSDCWPLQGPHKPKKKGRDGVPHEKTDPYVVRKLKSILHPTKNPEEIQRLHEEDEGTKWFGVARDLTGRPNLEDYGRYAALMTAISPFESQGNRYPQLVSFIGVTNAGKSTLIKMLVNHESDGRNEETRKLFPSPVVGSVVNDTLPTSGDVHLYADPSTHAEQLPILYADCEGFEGGERTPLGARSRKRARSDPTRDDPQRLDNVHARPIQWANTEESRQREYAVTALYPRLLYTFSDCVVFVLRNPKTFQSAVLTKLLDWGVSALEKSINQPALPHCIVALNGTDPSVDEREWDINYATQSLLLTVKGALDYVEGVPRFRELAEHWRALGKHIYTVEDLILRYYSSFKVVRIPSRPRYMQINEQIGKLHGTIKYNCDESFRSKRRARMLTNADELNTYLQSGFDHFTTHLHVPFNFMQVSLLRNPIPNDFGGHILQLCTTISSQQPNHQPGRVSWMFEKLSVMLASCVLLDCARFRKGRVDELFGSYEKFFDYAMGEYLELHYPCSYVSSDGRQCMLVKARHQPKGHQDEQGIIAAGDYMAAFDNSFLYRWKSQLRSAIESLHRDFSYELEQASQVQDTNAIPEERIALDLHIEYLNHFYEAVGPAASICSHSTCFCCLMDVPEHPLPCGHVLCTACIKAYGRQLKSTVSLSYCPLHREATKWARPALVKFKPAGAGVRILSLDGAGIRGIVQLEVLHAMEQCLGGHIAIQAFFDLIVGTGTGGMLAVALAQKDRSVDSCMDMFTAMCDHAFTPRMKGVPMLNQLIKALGSGRKYKTKPLYAALKTAFTEDADLFGSSQRLRPESRVALTTSSGTGRESILLASYRRPDDILPAYSFERPHEPDMELKVWESVAASLSNPLYFRPFMFHNKTYLDGGLRSPNPAFMADRERRLIWPDVGEPDLFLSLGTGQNRITVLEKLSNRPKENVPNTVIPRPGQTADEARRAAKRRRGKSDDVLEAEIAWQDFRSYAVKERSETKGRRFIRFNPDLDKEPPPQDSKSDLESLQLVVRKRLQTPHRLAALRNVAHRLVASSFYLDIQSKATAEKSEQLVSATLCCRFEDGTDDLRSLGKILADRRSEGFEPYFLIKPNLENSDMSSRLTITLDVMRSMVENGVFALPYVYIPLRDDTKMTSINLFLSKHDGLEPDGFPLSGFPRVILGETPATKPRRPTRGSSDQNLRGPIFSRHMKAGSDADSISLNGPARSIHSEDSWQETQAKVSPYLGSSGVPKMSLADLISQHQNTTSGTSFRNRTNRFWTYIGNNHMVQHPELYTEDELQKFAVTAKAMPSELPSPPLELSQSLSLSSLNLEPTNPVSPPAEPQELEARDKATRELQYAREVAVYRPGSDPHPAYRKQQQDKQPRSPGTPGTPTTPTAPVQKDRPDSQPRDPVPSACETVFEEEGDEDGTGSSYSSGQEAFAQGPPPYKRNEKSNSAESSPIDKVLETAMPDPSTKSALNRWLAQHKAGNVDKKSTGRLKIVHEEVIE